MKNQSFIQSKAQFVEQLKSLIEYPELILSGDLDNLIPAANQYKAHLLALMPQPSPVQHTVVEPTIQTISDGTQAMLDWLPTVLDRLAFNHQREASIEAMGRVESLVDTPWPDVSTDILCEVAHFIVAHAQAISERTRPADQANMYKRIAKLFRDINAQLPEDKSFIHGMALEHQPLHGSWQRDCTRWKNTLELHLGIAQHQEPRQTKSQPKKSIETHKELKLWPNQHQWQGKRVVIFGGVQNIQALNRLKMQSQANDIQWVDVQCNSGMRRVQSMCKRIEQGQYDVVIVLIEFVSHAASAHITEASEHCQLLRINKGYGTSQIFEAWTALCANKDAS